MAINKIDGCIPTVLLYGLPPGQTQKSNAVGKHFPFHISQRWWYTFSWGIAELLHQSLEAEEREVLSDLSLYNLWVCSIDKHGRRAHSPHPEFRFHFTDPSHTARNLKEITKAAGRIFSSYFLAITVNELLTNKLLSNFHCVQRTSSL